MIKQFAVGLEALHGDDSNGSLPSDRQWTRASIVSGLMHTLEVRHMYSTVSEGVDEVPMGRMYGGHM